MEGVSAGARLRIGCALDGHKMQPASAQRRCTGRNGVRSSEEQSAKDLPFRGYAAY